jgi:signal transduction histidine kinase
MANDDTWLQTLQELRRLAVTDPREASARIAAIIAGDLVSCDAFFQHLRAPADGRLRQIAAIQIGSLSNSDLFVKQLSKWLEIETDEFAKRTIQGTLKAVRKAVPDADDVPDPLPDLVDTYTFVSGRLSHRVRNALPGASMILRTLTRLLETCEDESVRSEGLAQTAALREALLRIGRTVEFNEGDEYFAVRSVPLLDWIVRMNAEYASKFEPISLAGSVFRPAAPSGEMTIQANDFLLETIFWNIWKNAQLVSAGECSITIHPRITEKSMELIFEDDGPGFPENVVDAAFQTQVSTQGEGHGRGLLEIKDAVKRLGGKVEFVKTETNAFRLKLEFPREES